MENITLESAEESYRFGFSATYDGDNQSVLYGTNCNRCGKYFEGETVEIYCKPCKNIKQ